MGVLHRRKWSPEGPGWKREKHTGRQAMGGGREEKGWNLMNDYCLPVDTTFNWNLGKGE